MLQDIHTDGLIAEVDTTSTYSRCSGGFSLTSAVILFLKASSRTVNTLRLLDTLLFHIFFNFPVVSLSQKEVEVRSLRVFSGFLLTNDEMPSLGITHLFIFPVVSHFC